MKQRFLPSLILAFSAATIIAAPLQKAQVTRIVNDVQVLDGSGSPRAAKENETIRQTNAVRTGTNSRAELVFDDKTLSRLGSNTVFRFTEGTRNMELSKGTMMLQVPKNMGGAKISTAAVTAAITGTTVMMEYSPAKDGGKGHVKILVLEGTLKVYLNNRVGESMLIEAGKMLICDPNAIVLPETVEFDLKKLIKTSKLLNDGGKNKNYDPSIVNQEVKNQQEDIKNGDLEQTNLYVNGDVLYVGPDENTNKQRDAQTEAAGAQEPKKDGAIPTLTVIESPNPYVIDNSTMISASPAITTNGITDVGVIFDPALHGSGADFFFGGRSELENFTDLGDANRFETEVSFAGPWAAFKFLNLKILGNPSIDISPAPSLALISQGDILVSTEGASFTPGVQSLMLGTVVGNIDIESSSIDGGAGQTLILWARGTDSDHGGQANLTSSTLNYAGGAVIIGATNFISFNNTTINAGLLRLVSANVLNIHQSDVTLNVTSLKAKARELNFDYPTIPATMLSVDLYGTDSLNLTSLSAAAPQVVNLKAGTGGITSSGSLIGINSVKTTGAIDVGGDLIATNIEAGTNVSSNAGISGKNIIAHTGSITPSSGGSINGINVVSAGTSISAQFGSLSGQAITAGTFINVNQIKALFGLPTSTYSIKTPVLMVNSINLGGLDDNESAGNGNTLGLELASLSAGISNVGSIILKGGSRISTIGKGFKGGTLNAKATTGGFVMPFSTYYKANGGNSMNGDGGDGGAINLTATTAGGIIDISGSTSTGVLNVQGGDGTMVGGKGGSITIKSGSSISVSGIINAKGGAGNNGGNGGTITLVSNGGPVTISGALNANTGVSNGVSYDGDGGTIDIKGGTIDVTGYLRASTDENSTPSSSAKNGGTVNINSTQTSHTATAISVSNSSEILAMINSASSGTGGKINFLAKAGTISIDGKVLARSEVNIRTPDKIDIGANANIRAAALKMESIGSGGQLVLNGGSQLTGDDTVLLYSGGTSGVLVQGSGQVTVTAGSSFVLNSPKLEIVQTASLLVNSPVLNVKVGSNASAATTRLYNISGYGNFTANGTGPAHMIPRINGTVSLPGATVTVANHVPIP